jgi:FMN phosphatase YigB (HAD superfamily)
MATKTQSPAPLFVDLKGTLTKTDLLFESYIELFKPRPSSESVGFQSSTPDYCVELRIGSLAQMRGDSRVGRVKALVFDLDGTLYRNAPVRTAMALRLASYVARDPWAGWRAVRFLNAYRQSQEILRTRVDHVGDGEQLALACRRTGTDAVWAAGIVARWMEQIPLDLVRRYMRPGLPELLEAARRRGFRIGLFSDYPAEAKLAAIGVAQFFDVVVSAQDPEVRRFKPSPRGLEVTLRRLGVARHHALYIGDRPDVDAAAARNAGISCVIIGRPWSVRGWGWVGMSGYRELRDALYTDTK